MALLIDTNLLVLLIVGSASHRFIAAHKRTRAYTVDDYALLGSFVSVSKAIVTTPNILSETSNLIRQCSDPLRARIVDAFTRFVLSTPEAYIRSTEAVQRSEFRRLGLTDAAILSAHGGEVTLLTDDLDLFLASALSGKRVINFTHERENRLR